jgi:hypothetical protein
MLIPGLRYGFLELEEFLKNLEEVKGVVAKI